MSDAKEQSEVAAGTPGQSAIRDGIGVLPLVFIVLGTVVMVLAAVGGGIYWLSKTGRLPIAGVAAATAPVAEKLEPVKTRVVVLEPLLVNLADQGGASYLRIVMALEVEDPPPLKDAKQKEEKPAEKGKAAVNEDEVKMRDVALTVLGRETSGSLLAPEGKEQLKETLRAAISAHVTDVKVVDVLFTEFLVQR
jgi:flagellar FliL protein